MKQSLPVALATLALLLVAPVATGHANYLSSEPERGARLDVPPREIVVVLSERVDPTGSGIELKDGDGNPVDLGEVHLENGNQPEFHAILSRDLPDGAYQVRWWAFSTVDQHTTSGTIGFAVGAFEPPSSGQSSGNTVDAGAAASRALLYAGFALAFGALAFHLFILRPDPAPALAEFVGRSLAAGAVLHLGGLVALVAHTHGASGLALDHFFSSEVGRLMAARLSIAALGLVASLWALRTGSATAWSTCTLLFLAAATGSARFGHASQHGWTAIAGDFVHLVAVSTWIGGLVLLLWALLQAPRAGWDAAGVRTMGVRFSRVALACVAVLALTGVLTGVTILGSPSWDVYREALGTSWGRALVAKIGLTVVMVGLAAMNRYVFLDDPDRPGPPLVRAVQRWVQGASDGRAGRLLDAPAGQGPARVRSFSRVVAVEACLGAVVVLLAGVLTSVGAPYSGPGAPSDGALLVSDAGEEFVGTLYLDPPPTRGSFSHARLYLADADGQPVEDNSCGRTDCLHLFLGTGNGSEGEEPHALSSEGEGWWTTQDLLFVAAGPHTIRVEVQTAYVYLDELRFEFEVA